MSAADRSDCNPSRMRSSIRSSKVSAGLRLCCGETVDLTIALIAQHKPVVRIEHGKTLDHVVEGCIQLNVLGLNNRSELLALGHVLVGANPSAAFDRMVDNADSAAVAQFDDANMGILPLDQLQDAFDISLAIIALEAAAAETVLEHLAQMRPPLSHLEGQAVHRSILVVAHDQPLVLSNSTRPIGMLFTAECR